MDEAKRKSEIRAAMAARRRTVSDEERLLAGRRICDNLRTLPSWTRVRHLAAFWPVGREPDITPALHEWIQNGNNLFLPRVEGQDPTAIQLYRVRDPETDLQPGTLSISEPNPERCDPGDPEEIEWIWVPGVAFDAGGGRLGRGKAYYDALLARFSPAVFRTGIAYDWQVVGQALPVEPWDQQLHQVVTDHRILTSETRRSVS